MNIYVSLLRTGVSSAVGWLVAVAPGMAWTMTGLP